MCSIASSRRHSECANRSPHPSHRSVGTARTRGRSAPVGAPHGEHSIDALASQTFPGGDGAAHARGRGGGATAARTAGPRLDLQVRRQQCARAGDPLRTHCEEQLDASDFESLNIRVSPNSRTQNGHTARRVPCSAKSLMGSWMSGRHGRRNETTFRATFCASMPPNGPLPKGQRRGWHRLVATSQARCGTRVQRT